MLVDRAHLTIQKDTFKLSLSIRIHRCRLHDSLFESVSLFFGDVFRILIDKLISWYLQVLRDSINVIIRDPNPTASSSAAFTCPK
jgi:hypothetical protein